MPATILSSVVGLQKSLITLLTDFGIQDYFVGAMKGVILSANRAARIVDITHDIPSQDIRAGAFNLLATYKDFPAGTIHIAVVDPGVGSNRRPIMIECADQMFVGPDNGVFSWICEREGACVARHLTNKKFFRQPTSATFHGRDVFAPVAAALSNGVAAEEFGPIVEDIVKLESVEPEPAKGMTRGVILHVDKFGNCITNLRPEHFPKRDQGSAKLLVNETEITAFREFFSEDGSAEGEPFMIEGSAGFIEVALRNSSAAALLGAQPGQPVFLIH